MEPESKIKSNVVQPECLSEGFLDHVIAFKNNDSSPGKSAYRKVAFCGLAGRSLSHFDTPQMKAVQKCGRTSGGRITEHGTS